MAKGIDPAILQFCTPRQRPVIEAVLREGSIPKAAKSLGFASTGTVRGYIDRVKRQAAMRGWSPEHNMTRPLPETHYAKGVSALYKRGEAEPVMEWVKSAADPNKLHIVAQEAARSFFSASKPLKAVKPPKRVNDDLLTCYVIADLHIGMFAWAGETGENYDCKIAGHCLDEAVDRLIARTPPSKECTIAQLGDLLHLDDDTNQTKRSHNNLDVDSRYPKVTEIALRLYRRVIDRALQRHETVHIVNVPGNHDAISTYWLGVAIETAYENEPRVSIDSGFGPYFYRTFGDCLLGFAHGHTCKMADLGEIMVADRPEEAGAAIYRYFLTGHIHHDRVHEGRICRAESFRTLAAKDFHHHQRGYRSMRDMQAIIYHRRYGEDERFTVGVREIMDGKE